MAGSFYIAAGKKGTEVTQRAESEALFGSVSRGDCDRLSDRDILIVDDDIKLLQRRSAFLKQKGWSVASYTFGKLNTLADRGALFLQHLKLEASIVTDRTGRLVKVLNNFEAKKDYSAELAENSDLANLARYRPSGKLGDLWAADVLYVAVRNHGILKLAELRQHAYAYSDVLIAMRDFGWIDEQAVAPLLKLRLAKSLYRAGENNIPECYPNAWLDQAFSYLPLELQSSPAIMASPVAVLINARNLAESVPSYHRLRALERALVALQTLGISGSDHAAFVKLKSWIENPRAYASMATVNEKNLNRMFERVGRSLITKAGWDGAISLEVSQRTATGWYR